MADGALHSTQSLGAVRPGRGGGLPRQARSYSVNLELALHRRWEIAFCPDRA